MLCFNGIIWIDKFNGRHYILYTMSQKTCHYMFDCNLNENCSIVIIIIFGTGTFVIWSCWKVILLSHLTYFVPLSCLEKLSNTEYPEFSLKLLIFTMLQVTVRCCLVQTCNDTILLIFLFQHKKTITTCSSTNCWYFPFPTLDWKFIQQPSCTVPLRLTVGEDRAY